MDFPCPHHPCQHEHDAHGRSKRKRQHRNRSFPLKHQLQNFHKHNVRPRKLAHCSIPGQEELTRRHVRNVKNLLSRPVSFLDLSRKALHANNGPFMKAARNYFALVPRLDLESNLCALDVNHPGGAGDFLA